MVDDLLHRPDRGERVPVAVDDGGCDEEVAQVAELCEDVVILYLDVASFALVDYRFRDGWTVLLVGLVVGCCGPFDVVVLVIVIRQVQHFCPEIRV
jgi:hypothetical protein